MSSVNTPDNNPRVYATKPIIFQDPNYVPPPPPKPTDSIAPSREDPTIPTAATSAGTPVLSSKSDDVSIAAYGKSIGQAVRLFKESSVKDMRDDINIFKSYTNSTLQDLIALQEFLNWAYNFEKISTQLQQGYQDAAAPVNQQITNFNNSTLTPDDVAAIKAMNDATTKYNEALASYQQVVTDYNNGLVSEEDFTKATENFNVEQANYNVAVGVYNAYGSIRNAVLPGLIDQFNQGVVANFDKDLASLYLMIDQYNQQAAGKNLPPMPYPPKPATLDPTAYAWQPLPFSPTTYPIPTIPDRPTAIATINVTVPIQAIQIQVEAIQIQINDAVDMQLAAIKALCDERDLEQGAMEYYEAKLKISLNTANPLLDGSTIKSAVSSISRKSENESSITGSNFINMYGKTLSPDLLAPLDNDPNVNMTQETKTKITQLLQVATAQYMVSSSLLGGKDAIDALGTQASTVNPKGSAGQVAVALGFTKEVQKLSEGDFYEQTVDQILKSQGITASPDALKKVASDLRLNTALISLFQISKAIQAPQLTRLIIALAAGNAQPAVTTALNEKPETTLFQTLKEPVAQVTVKQSVQDTLTKQMGISKETAATMTDNVINRVIAQQPPISTENELNDALVKGFAQENLNPTQAAALAQQAVSVLKDEQQHPELNLLLTRADLDKAVQQDPLFLDTAIAKVVNQVRVNGDISSFRDFRDELRQEFQLSGLTPSAAADKTNQVMAALMETSQSMRPQQTPKKSDPLTAMSNTTTVNQDQIKDALSTKMIQLLRKELDVPTSHQISHDLINVLLSDNNTSVVNVIRNSMKSIDEQGAKESEEKLVDKIRTYTAPDQDLYAFTQAAMDPGTAVLFTAATGIMYQKNEPNHQNVNVLI